MSARTHIGCDVQDVPFIKEFSPHADRPKIVHAHTQAIIESVEYEGEDSPAQNRI